MAVLCRMLCLRPVEPQNISKMYERIKKIMLPTFCMGLLGADGSQEAGGDMQEVVEDELDG
jgi:hypothetical protein